MGIVEGSVVGCEGEEGFRVFRGGDVVAVVLVVKVRSYFLFSPT